jgi:UDP-glucose:(heptosyl)LPS alpha-1,3-glucosyltransferase
MRVALVVERFEARGGGVEAVAWVVAHGLAEAGDEVHVFARWAQAAEPNGPRVHRLAVPAAWQPARVLAFSRAAARAAPRGSFDVVQSFSRTRHQDVYRAGGGCHAAYMEQAYGARSARWRRLAPRHAVILRVEGAVFRDRSQLVLCNSEMVRDEIAARYGVPDDRLAVIVNGVDLERHHPGRREEEGLRLRAALGAGDMFVWLLAGSGFRRKGVDTALRALARQREGSALWIAGGDDPAPWRALAARLGVTGRVRFLGRRDDLPALYAAADALALPTRYDAFANVCLEAAASGLPVVTSGANGAARWLGAAGVTVEDPEDAAGFAAALDALAGDPARRRALGAAARRRAEEASWARHLEALRTLYLRVGAR